MKLKRLNYTLLATAKAHGGPKPHHFTFVWGLLFFLSFSVYTPRWDVGMIDNALDGLIKALC